jgi:hypothetical protein
MSSSDTMMMDADEHIVVLPGVAFASVAAAIDGLGFDRDADRTDVATHTPGEPSFASWSRPFPDDGEVDYHFDPKRGERWIVVRGENAPERACELAAVLGGKLAGTLVENLAALLTRPSRESDPRPTVSGAERWRTLRTAVAMGPLMDKVALTALLLAGLSDPDWRVRMTAMIGAAHLGITSLANAVATTDVPPFGQDVGLEAEDRRILLALRQAAADLLHGASMDVRADVPLADDIQAKRTAYQRHLRRLLTSKCEPHDDAALLLTALLTPQALGRPGSFPALWESWMS